eukprot:scaffold957_cov402-Prasinococcus_capsulatus_cf.AAC.11
MDAIELGAFFASLPEDSRIHHRMVDIHSYFAELSQYKFMIAPRGNGIQSPKFLEAILVFTIPVTKSYACFEQLQSYGFPIVLVDDWHTITEAFLESEWARLSPSLPKARWIGTNRGVRSLYFQECTGSNVFPRRRRPLAFFVPRRPADAVVAACPIHVLGPRSGIRGKVCARCRLRHVGARHTGSASRSGTLLRH